MNLTALELLFWIGMFIVFYTYVGYGFVLYFFVRLKALFTNSKNTAEKEFVPAVTFVVAAYNEARWMDAKIKNCLAFDYPKEKITFLFVTDGSSDETPEMVKNYILPKGVKLELYHSPERKGKIAAVERIMKYVKTPITIYTDANTFVNPEAIKNIVKHYANPKVGAVAGEKRIALDKLGDAAGAGEGIYWKYESKLKKWDSDLNSVVGAAGELFSIRTELFEAVPSDTVIEDFYMTMRIAEKGFKVKYANDAFAREGQSASVSEELKRKIRIAAGGWQAISRLGSLLNFFKHPILTFQYISHRVLRWTFAPFALPMILILNIILAQNGTPLYQWLLIAQIIFYCAAIIGYLMEKKKLKFKAFFVPYYFCVMNYAVYRGFFRFLFGSQSVLWERAKRA